MKILVVDDEEHLKKMYRPRILNVIPDIEIDWSCRFTEARTLVESNHYDMAIIDVNLTHLGPSGLALLPNLMRNNVVSVILSGVEDELIKQKALLAGASYYILKDGIESVTEASACLVKVYSSLLAKDFLQNYFFKKSDDLAAFTRRIIESYMGSKNDVYYVSGPDSLKYIEKINNFLKKEISLERTNDYVFLSNDLDSSFEIPTQNNEDYANAVASILKKNGSTLQRLAIDLLIQYSWSNEAEAIDLANELLKLKNRRVLLKELPPKYQTKINKKLQLKVPEIPKVYEEILLEHGWHQGVQIIKQNFMASLYNKFNNSYALTGRKLDVSRKTVWGEINGQQRLN